MAKKPVAQDEQFVFEVGTPSWAYHFSLQHDRRDPDPYWEHQSLEFPAQCLHPDRFKGREARVRLLGSRDLAARDRGRSREKAPNGVGFIEIRGQRFEVMLSLPNDACWEVGHAISVGSIRYLVTNGPRLFRGSALIRSMSLDGPSFDLADYTC
jgi:hypothetical protein